MNPSAKKLSGKPQPDNRSGALVRGLLTFIALLGICAPASAQAQNRPVGEKLVTAYECTQCHSADGTILFVGAPRLAGQKYGYLYRQLSYFKNISTHENGELVAYRRHSLMNVLARRLSDGQLKRMALYYASRSCEGAAPVTPVPLAPPNLSRCETCHGGETTAAWADTPSLAGQDRTYLETSIQRLWDARQTAARATGDDIADRYHKMAKLMFTDDDAPYLKDYAAYYAALPCKDQ